MPVTSTHKETGRFLTSFNRDSKAGDEHCISVGHPLLGGEFTTYRLPEPVAHDEHGPLFDIDSADCVAEIKMGYDAADPSTLR